MEKKSSQIKAPIAKKKDFSYEKFGNTIHDPYHWLSDRDSKEALDYLQAENRYAALGLKPLEGLKKSLFEEMKGRLPEKRDQEPVSMGEYFYYTAWEKEKPYPILKRRKKSNSKEEILLDQNSLHSPSGYLSVFHRVSPNHHLLAFARDERGREFYNISFKNLKTKELLKVSIPSATRYFVWANDSRTLFYTRQDRKSLRSFQVYRFDIDTGQSHLVFEEKDPEFVVYLYKSLCQKKIMIGLINGGGYTTEVRYISANRPHEPAVLFCRRESKHAYYLFYGEGFFYILTNKDGAFNFKLMRAKETPQPKAVDESACPYPLWEELIPHREEVCLSGFEVEVFKDFIALNTRSKGRQEIEILHKKDGRLSQVLLPKGICSVYSTDNEEYDSPFVRLNYQSLTQPLRVYDYFVREEKLELKQQTRLQGGFSPENYVSAQEYALSKDGLKIPISLVYRKDLKIKPSTPLLLYAYGAGGMSSDPIFKSSVVSLLDRGFIYAIAHVRGGGEKGEKWHEGGSLLNKKNSFTDFISCLEHLIDRSYTSPRHTYIEGVSAGGLLVGAVLNQRPDLVHSALARVPFVDCLTSSLDESIPLATSYTYSELGNPNEKRYYDYMRSYSPYDNVKKMSYPHLLISAGLHDSRVQYWEPAKWTAKLREHKTDNNKLFLLTDMKSGHFGSTDRLKRLKASALSYAFLIGIEQSLI